MLTKQSPKHLFTFLQHTYTSRLEKNIVDEVKENGIYSIAV